MDNVIPLHPDRTFICDECLEDRPEAEVWETGYGARLCDRCKGNVIEERRAALLAAALDVLGGIK